MAVGEGTGAGSRAARNQDRLQVSAQWLCIVHVLVAENGLFRHIDAAHIYGNEGEVGQGIKESGIAREELFVTSKLWNSEHAPEKVEPAVDETLKNLGLSYLDLYIIQ